jgi:hypothetical protein
MLLLISAGQASKPKRNRQILAILDFRFLCDKLITVTSNLPIYSDDKEESQDHCSVISSLVLLLLRKECALGVLVEGEREERERALCVAFPIVTVVVTLFSVTRANGVQGWAWHRPMGNRRDSKDGLLLAAPTQTIGFSCSYWFSSPFCFFFSLFSFLFSGFLNIKKPNFSWG